MNNLNKFVSQITSREKQSGQAIVLIAALMIILLASLGLAIDGGGMFLLWRDAQNAADTAAIQAAFAYCTAPSNRVNAAIDRGMTAIYQNGFQDAELPALPAGQNDWTAAQKIAAAKPIADFENSSATVDAEIGQAITMFPASQLSVGTNSSNDLMAVRIRAKKPAYFIQLVYHGPMMVTVTALGACNPGGSIYEGYGIFTTATEAVCGSGHPPLLGNSGSWTYFDDSLYANDEMDMSGKNVVLGSDATLNYYNQTTSNIQVTVSGGADPNTQPVTEQQTNFPPLFRYTDFTKSNNSQVYQDITAQDAITPNTWTDDHSSYHVNEGGGLKLQGNIEGLYVARDDIEITGGNSASSAQIGPNGITLVSKQGHIFTKGGDLNNAESAWQPYVGNTVTAHILAFTEMQGTCSAGQGGSGIQLGGSNITGRGLLYAPNSNIYFSGNDTVWCGALIGLTVNLQGDSKWFFSKWMPPANTLMSMFTNPKIPDSALLIAGNTGYNCNYLPEPAAPSYFVADLNP